MSLRSAQRFARSLAPSVRTYASSSSHAPAASSTAGTPSPVHPNPSAGLSPSAISPHTSNPATKSPTHLAQAPNHAAAWSASQNPREAAMSGPRFEQTNLDLQARPFSAMQAVSEDPIRMVNGRKATCDGGGGPLGHPKIFINLDKPGPKPCGYCGIRFEQAHHDHH